MSGNLEKLHEIQFRLEFARIVEFLRKDGLSEPTEILATKYLIDRDGSTQAAKLNEKEN